MLGDIDFFYVSRYLRGVSRYTQCIGGGIQKVVVRGRVPVSQVGKQVRCIPTVPELGR